MAVKIAGKLRGESASEQYGLEKKRFNMRQENRKPKIKNDDDPTQNKFNMEENL